MLRPHEHTVSSNKAKIMYVDRLAIYVCRKTTEEFANDNEQDSMEYMLLPGIRIIFHIKTRKCIGKAFEYISAKC